MSVAPCRESVLKIGSMKELNERVTRVARVVVHPKYRTTGAGVKLVHYSLPLCGKPYVEMIAVMARYNPFAEHAGMTKVCESKPDKSILDAVAELEKPGFTPYLLAVTEYNKRMLKKQVPRVKKILSARIQRIKAKRTHPNVGFDLGWDEATEEASALLPWLFLGSHQSVFLISILCEGSTLTNCQPSAR